MKEVIGWSRRISLNESRALWQTHPLSLFHCKDKGYPLLLVEIKGIEMKSGPPVLFSLSLLKIPEERKREQYWLTGGPLFI